MLLFLKFQPQTNAINFQYSNLLYFNKSIKFLKTKTNLKRESLTSIATVSTFHSSDYQASVSVQSTYYTIRQVMLNKH